MFSLAMPVVLSSFLQRSVGIVDIFLVGGLGASAIAAVGVAQIMIFVVMSVSWGINVGVTVLVSQLWGADRKDEAGKAAYQAMLAALLAAIVIMVVGHLAGWKVAGLLGANEEVQQILYSYSKIIFTFILFTISINVLSGHHARSRRYQDTALCHADREHPACCRGISADLWEIGSSRYGRQRRRDRHSGI